MPKINQKEYEVLKGLGDTWKWIARDKDSVLGVYDAKVVKTKFHNFWVMAIKKKIDLTLFSFIQWEDEEPYNIAELIEEYEFENVLSDEERFYELCNINGSEETGVKKDKKWLEDEVDKVVSEYQSENIFANFTRYMIYDIKDVINQLDEPEVLSQEWIDEHAEHHEYIGYAGVPVDDLQNLLVPKQKEVGRAYKAGYETGKQHTFYKGYLEGLADKKNEPETVADVVTTFWKSFERLKEVMSIEVEELGE